MLRCKTLRFLLTLIFKNCSLGDNSTLVTLFRSLKVVLALEDLVTTNRALRAVWEERKTKILTLIRDIVATPLCTS